jgi:CubicO group peptidase (beta-lactamase class C family)
MISRREAIGAAGALALGVGPATALPDSDIAGLIEPIRTQHDLPALAAAVIVEGKPAAAGVTGVRKHGDRARAEPEDRFHLGSCTKAMTAVLIGMLVEERKLHWTTPLPELLPNMAATMHPDLRSVTVDHLLAHRSGLSPKLHPRPSSLAKVVEAWKSPEVSRSERLAFVETVLKTKPDSLPAEKFAYCNAGYTVLGAIAERLWDAPWEELMRRRVFGPLGMASGGFGAMGTPGKLDQPWQHRLRDGKHVPVEPGAFSDNPPALGPAGTAHCSVADWAKFLAAVVNGQSGAGHLLKPETWKRLLAPQFGGEYAGGWGVTSREWGGRVLTHAGSNTMSYCVAWLAPEKRFGAAIMTNQGGDEAARACDEAAWAVIQAFLLKKRD